MIQYIYIYDTIYIYIFICIRTYRYINCMYIYIYIHIDIDIGVSNVYTYIYIYIHTNFWIHVNSHDSTSTIKINSFSKREVVCCLPCYRWKKRTSQLSTEKRVARTRFVQGQRLKRRSRMRPGAFSRLTITAKVMGLEDYAVYVTLCNSM